MTRGCPIVRENLCTMGVYTGTDDLHPSNGSELDHLLVYLWSFCVNRGVAEMWLQ